MNCSSPNSKLETLLKELYAELTQRMGNETKPASSATSGDALYLVVLIMVMYAMLAGGLILAYTRSRKNESKSDPYHLYIERDWSMCKNARNLDNEEQEDKGSLGPREQLL